MTDDKDLPSNWPRDWPRSLEEFKKMLTDDDLIAYLEDRGIYLRYDKKTDKVTIKADKGWVEKKK